MSVYQWVTLGLGALGFLGTWILGAFYLGRAVEQMRAAVKEYIDDERDKIIHKIDAVEEKFVADQRTQDHNFGEVGAAMRQYIADVEKKLREVEIYGRDNYVKIPDFEKAIDRMGETMMAAVAEIKEDMRRLLKPTN
jgi:cytosine/adenosine deaminase-related metal-dependent hydrolase